MSNALLAYCEEPWEPVARAGFRAGNGRSLGYVDYFSPLYQDDNRLVFINPKGVIGRHRENEQNIGLGYRHLLSDNGVIGGVNAYFDSRRTAHNNRFEQIGAGFELLTRTLDFRANFYLPLSNEKQVGQTVSYGFAPVSIIRTTTSIFEEPLAGLDVEVGALVPGISSFMETRAFAGGFRYDSKLSKNRDGFRGRLEIQPHEMVTLSMEIKNDNVSDMEFVAGGYISIPLGSRKKSRFFSGTRPLRKRMTDPVVRDIDIVAPQTPVAQKDTVVSNVIYVNNANDADLLEDGTLDHPHNTLTEAFTNSRYAAGTTIFVDAGDGTAVGYTGLFTLSNRVVLWGEGYEAFPGLGGGSYPLIDGGAMGRVITLASNNTVQGLQLQNGTRGITGTNPGNVTLRNNIVTNIDSVDDTVAGINLTITETTASSITISSNVINDIAFGLLLVPVTHITGISLDIRSDNSSQILVDQNRISNIRGDNAVTAGIVISDGGVGGQTGFRISRNRITDIQNGGDGIRVVDSGTPFVIDAGGGALGSEGLNAIGAAPDNQIDNGTGGAGTVKAENNFWGGGAGVFSGPVDGDPFLTIDPGYP